MESFKKWYQDNKQKIQEDFFTLLKFESISTDPTYHPKCIDCANWLKNLIEEIGLKSELIQTSTLPIVYAEDLSSSGPTLLIYGHYDVQPVDPLNLWKSPPFEPTIRDGQVYARGAIDNKGQHFYTLMAIKAFKELNKEFPINIKVCLEGEEEAGSHGFIEELPKLKEKLRADYLIVPDVDLIDEMTPTITFGARGMLAFEIELTGSNTDLHSGSHGGLAYNPNRALSELLAKLWDKDGRVTIEGFYDDVKELTSSEKEHLTMTFDREKYSKEFGIKAFSGEKGYSPSEANWIRPTIEINGISGGYTGKGFKTVIPAVAKAKISCRLVADQDPKKIQSKLHAFFEKNVHPGIDLKIHFYDGARASRGSFNSKIAKALSKSLCEVFDGKKVANIFAGGSIPIVADLAKATGSEPVLMGMGLFSDNIHAPNEHFGLDRFEKGFLTIAKTIDLLGK